jgi:hypothetical protein
MNLTLRIPVFVKPAFHAKLVVENPSQVSVHSLQLPQPQARPPPPTAETHLDTLNASTADDAASSTSHSNLIPRHPEQARRGPFSFPQSIRRLVG